MLFFKDEKPGEPAKKTFGAKGKPTTNSAHMASTPETLTVRWRSRRCPKELKTLLPFNMLILI